MAKNSKSKALPKRYEPENDYSQCYYEGDSPDIKMVEGTKGEWVRYSDYELLLKELQDVSHK